MIKLLILILLGFVGYSMIQGMIRPKEPRGGKMPRNRSRDGEEMVEDPQCGTFLPVSDSVSATIDGQIRHFCSKKCLKEYKKKNT
jgi:YHS domain-containing protein